MWRRGREVIVDFPAHQLKVTVILGAISATVTFDGQNDDLMRKIELAVQWRGDVTVSNIARSGRHFTYYMPKQSFPKRGDPVWLIESGIRRLITGEHKMLTLEEPRLPRERKPRTTGTGQPERAQLKPTWINSVQIGLNDGERRLTLFIALLGSKRDHHNIELTGDRDAIRSAVELLQSMKAYVPVKGDYESAQALARFSEGFHQLCRHIGDGIGGEYMQSWRNRRESK